MGGGSWGTKQRRSPSRGVSGLCSVMLSWPRLHTTRLLSSDKGLPWGKTQDRHWFLFDLQGGCVLRVCPAIFLCSEGQ